MADLETTQAKLRSTPTAGVSGEHSAYYRRLLSAGYKGYIQGSIGGGTLYGSIGLAIGAIVALPLIASGVGIAALGLVPALGAAMGFYGAHAFADIGKTAAIIADSADTNEKRRYLLDRYYETPNDLEAAEIKRQLESEHESKKPEQIFHWRPALIGIAIGLTLGALAFAMPAVGVHLFAMHMIESIGIAHAALPLVGAAIGGLAGSVIGVDREYIRRWLDKSEFAVHETHHSEKQIAAREQDIERIAAAARRGEVLAARAQEHAATKIHMTEPLSAPALERRPDPIRPEMVAGLPDQPSTKVDTRDAMLSDRLAGMQYAPNI